MPRCCRWLGSPGLAVVLLTALAATLATGALLHQALGREYAQEYVYETPWLLGLLTLLVLNVLATVVVRFPESPRQAGFLVAHVGVLALLAGVMQTHLGGIEGQVLLREGQPAAGVVALGQSQITVLPPAGGPPATWTWQPGPTDWPAGRVRDLGPAGGVGLKVLQFYRHAQPRTDWAADEKNAEGAAVHLRLFGPSGHLVTEDWLSGGLFGGEAVLGATRCELLLPPVASMLDDFRSLPADDLGRAGILAIHHGGIRQPIRVDEHLGKRLPIGTSGLEVEIADYLPNARPMGSGRFQTLGDQPKNPVLELKVYLPGQEQPVRQVAFAKRPLLNLDGVRGAALPVKFWYHHAAVKPAPGAAFLQTPDGKLYCRAVANGAYQAARPVLEGDRIALGADFTLVLDRHLPYARQEVTFLPAAPAAGAAADSEGAALVELTVGDERRAVWLRRQDDQYGTQAIRTAQGPFTVAFGYHVVPLDARLELERLARRTNREPVQDGAVVGVALIGGAAGGAPERRPIAMHEPLRVGKFTLRPAGFQEVAGHSDTLVLNAAYDPGRWLKYVGGLLAGVGILVMFGVRPRARKTAGDTTAADPPPQPVRLAA